MVIFILKHKKVGSKYIL